MKPGRIMDGVSIVIPTYDREEVLVESIRLLLELETQADEILVVDQTPTHDDVTRQQLATWNDNGRIRWIKRTTPSITQAMNCALREAASDLVLFLDDDIVPRNDIVREHHRAHRDQPELWATVGQVIQPWQEPQNVDAPRKTTGLRVDEDFPFHSTHDMDVRNVMAGNLCVNRQRALSIGGFDENFVGSAYRFETEFARRVGKAGGKIRFLGSAGIDHLRAERGGTRDSGSHLTSADPKHGIGDHYFAFLHGSRTEAWTYSISRIFREVRTRFHLTHPWWIPVKLVGEVQAMRQGYSLARKKRRE